MNDSVSVNVFESVQQLKTRLESSIIGQQMLVQRILIALLVDGHLLVEGAPGLAKTRAIKALADNMDGDFQRLQFTPDLLPADLTGTEVYRPADGSFVFQKGPLFNNLILADEINRAPAKVQSALLEAMAEQQISVGHETYPLPELFMVMATQNPIEQEGTYSLPEAQLDRFMLHVFVDYPDASHEAEILRLVREETRSSQHTGGTIAIGQSEQQGQVNHTGSLAQPEQTTIAPLSMQTIFTARREVLDVHLADNVEDYIVRLVTATRSPENHSEELARWINFGASPRGTLALDACSRAHAWLDGRDFVSPTDVQAVVHDVLRHRILLSFDAEADGVSGNDIIDRLLQLIAVP